jgi:hypothetical protein
MKVYGPLEVAQLEWFTTAGRPAPSAYPYRVIFDTDQKTTLVSDGTNWTSSGGGGGGSLQWVEAALSPSPVVANNIQVYNFQAADTQYLYALIKVSQSYAPGNPIKLRMTFYSPDSSGTALVSSLATLIRPGTDAITSTTNQRTSTNAAVTLSGGTVNIPQNLILDLTSSTGQINAVSVSAGDLILVRLTRGTDTATSDISVPVYGADTTLN